MLFSFTSITILWIFIKKNINSAGEVSSLHRELHKLKFNPEHVESLFSKQQTMPPIFDEMEVVTLGNLNAMHTLTIVTNPVCHPCAKIHKELENILETTEDIKCDIVFAPTNAVSTQVARLIMNLPTNNRAYALHQWFNQGNQDIRKWHKSIKNIYEDEETVQQIFLHFRWRELGNVVRTPTIFLNGIDLPILYDINDIVHLCKTISRSEELLDLLQR